MNKITIEQVSGRTIIRAPVSYKISQLVKYARAQGQVFTSYRVVSDPFTAKFRTFGIQLIG